jgi:hypothetical protein
MYNLAILNDSFVDGKTLFRRYETVAVRIKPGEEIVFLAGKANDSALDLNFFLIFLFNFHLVLPAGIANDSALDLQYDVKIYQHMSG